jgi:hypothetical protein
MDRLRSVAEEMRLHGEDGYHWTLSHSDDPGWGHVRSRLVTSFVLNALGRKIGSSTTAAPLHVGS